MPKGINERFVRRAVISFLGRKGWDRGLREKETAEHGVDIRVRHNKYARYFFIETKGESAAAKHPGSSAEVAFVYCLGQIITRMKTGKARYYYGLGLPESSARIAIRRVPWQVAKRLLLHVFSVNSAGKVRQFDWKYLKEAQEQRCK